MAMIKPSEVNEGILNGVKKYLSSSIPVAVSIDIDTTSVKCLDCFL